MPDNDAYPEVMYRISDATLLQLVTRAADMAEAGTDPRRNRLYRFALLEAERRTGCAG